MLPSSSRALTHNDLWPFLILTVMVLREVFLRFREREVINVLSSGSPSVPGLDNDKLLLAWESPCSTSVTIEISEVAVGIFLCASLCNRR